MSPLITKRYKKATHKKTVYVAKSSFGLQQCLRQEADQIQTYRKSVQSPYELWRQEKKQTFIGTNVSIYSKKGVEMIYKG